MECFCYFSHSFWDEIIIAFDHNYPFSDYVNWVAFCHVNFDDDCFKVAWIHQSFSSTPSRSSKICTVCKLFYCWDECRFNVEFSGILPGVAVCTVTDVSINAKGFIATFIAVWSTSLQQYYVHYLQRKYSLTSFNLLGQTAPAQAATLLLLGPFFGLLVDEQEDRPV